MEIFDLEIVKIWLFSYNLLHQSVYSCFFYNFVHKAQMIFTTNKIKRDNYNKIWDYANTIPITTKVSLELNTKYRNTKRTKQLLRSAVFILHKKVYNKGISNLLLSIQNVVVDNKIFLFVS